MTGKSAADFLTRPETDLYSPVAETGPRAGHVPNKTFPSVTENTMSRKVTATGAFFFALLFWFSSFALGKLRPISPVPGWKPSSCCGSGQQLELERRWGDAISDYEEAVRQFPEDRQIEQRFEVARLHYDLGRRYNDQSFCNCVQQLSAEQALDLYYEVLLKVQAHYVECPTGRISWPGAWRDWTWR